MDVGVGRVGTVMWQVWYKDRHYRGSLVWGLDFGHLLTNLEGQSSIGTVHSMSGAWRVGSGLGGRCDFVLDRVEALFGPERPSNGPFWDRKGAENVFFKDDPGPFGVLKHAF